MKDFISGVTFASVMALFGYTLYEVGKANGRKEVRKDQRTISDELIKTIEALRKKIES